MTRHGVFQSGDVDVAGISVNVYLKYMVRTDITIRNYTSRDFEFISMNLEDPVLSDIYARRAIALSIDRKSIISELLRGAAEEADLPVLPSCWLEDAREACPGQETGAGGQAQESSENGVPGDAEDVAGNNGEGDAQPVSGDAADLYSARTPEEVLTLGGWKQSQQGYYKVIKGSRRHLELEMLVNSNNSLRVRAAEMICGQLEQAGIKVKLFHLSWNDMVSRVNSGKYKMAFLGCRVPQIPDISYMYWTGLPMRHHQGFEA